jgi:hypothetical protein
VSFYEQAISGSVYFVEANRIKALLCQIVICTSANTSWRTAGTVQAFMECAETTPTFFAWYQYYAYSE